MERTVIGRYSRRTFALATKLEAGRLREQVGRLQGR
jgi:hypothetical protein